MGGARFLPTPDPAHMHAACSAAQPCLTLCDAMDYDPPGSSVCGGFPRQEYWSGLPFPSPEDRPDPESKPMPPASPALVGRFFTNEPPGKPMDPACCRGNASGHFLAHLLWSRTLAPCPLPPNSPPHTHTCQDLDGCGMPLSPLLL